MNEATKQPNVFGFDSSSRSPFISIHLLDVVEPAIPRRPRHKPNIDAESNPELTDTVALSQQSQVMGQASEMSVSFLRTERRIQCCIDVPIGLPSTVVGRCRFTISLASLVRLVQTHSPRLAPWNGIMTRQVVAQHTEAARYRVSFGEKQD